MKLRTIFILLLAPVLMSICGCEFWFGVDRKVALEAPIPEDCIRQSLRIAEITSIREYKLDDFTSFIWMAQKADAWAQGGVHMAREDGKLMLKLETGNMNGFTPEGIEYGKKILDAIYSNLEARCQNVPPRSLLQEKCVRVCK